MASSTSMITRVHLVLWLALRSRGKLMRKGMGSCELELYSSTVSIDHAIPHVNFVRGLCREYILEWRSAPGEYCQRSSVTASKVLPKSFPAGLHSQDKNKTNALCNDWLWSHEIARYCPWLVKSKNPSHVNNWRSVTEAFRLAQVAVALPPCRLQGKKKMRLIYALGTPQ